MIIDNRAILPDENGEDKKIQIEVENKGNVEINVNFKPSPKLDYEKEMYNAIKSFEIDAWSDKSDGFKTGFKSIDDALDGGLKPGFYLIAADSNVGKSIMVSQLAWQIVINNKDVYVMDFSLDDPFPDKISRVVACNSKIPINSVKNPKKYYKFEKIIKRREIGLSYVYNSSDKYRIYSSVFTTDIEKIEEEIIRIKLENEVAGIDKKIVVFIDNFHDLTTREHPNYQDKQKYDHIAQVCADISIKYNIPLICTAELRKVNGNFRSTPDAIRESVKIKYEAKAILMCHNEVHYKGEGADVYFMRSDKPEKQPIFEVHFAKNKISSFKGRLFFESYPEMSFLKECNDNDSKLYASQIFS